MGLSRQEQTRREATFAVLEDGLEAFAAIRARLKRQSIVQVRSIDSLIRERGFDPKAWREIEYVLTKAGVDLARLTRIESSKLDHE